MVLLAGQSGVAGAQARPAAAGPSIGSGAARELIRKPALDIELYRRPPSVFPISFWSDGTTAWLESGGNDAGNTLYAYDLAARTYDPARNMSVGWRRDYSRGITRRDNGFWSDGRTMWVARSRSVRDAETPVFQRDEQIVLFAYDLSSGDRDRTREIATDIVDERNRGYASASGIWSDGRTMWVGVETGGVRAYTLENGAPDPARDIDTGGMEWIQQIWSDGRTMWVTFASPITDREILAYDLATGSRDPANDFPLDILASHNIQPRGLWSDGETTWVLGGDRIVAFERSTMRRDPARDFNDLGPRRREVVPVDAWSDGKTMWVREIYGALLAYDLETRTVAPDKHLLGTAPPTGSNRGNYGMWSDGETMWVVQARPVAVMAYDMATGGRDPDRDVRLAAENADPYDLWSDGATMWVLDGSDEKLYAYDMATLARQAARDVDVQWDEAREDGNYYDPRAVYFDRICADGTVMWVGYYIGGRGDGGGAAEFYRRRAYDVATGTRDASRDGGRALVCWSLHLVRRRDVVADVQQFLAHGHRPAPSEHERRHNRLDQDS